MEQCKMPSHMALRNKDNIVYGTSLLIITIHLVCRQLHLSR